VRADGGPGTPGSAVDCAPGSRITIPLNQLILIVAPLILRRAIGKFIAAV
jgi:hypothetical protein